MNIKKLYILLVLLCFAFVTNAQHKPFQFGFQGGFNVGWFKVEDAEFSNKGANIGGSYGFVADFFLMENYSFTTGVNILYINGTTTMNDENGVLERKFVTRYLQLPLIFTMKTKLIKDKFRIYGQVGYGLAFLLRARSSDELTDNEGNITSEKTNARDEMTFTRSSLILGLGLEIPIHGSTLFRIGTKFDNCFLTMFKGDDFKVKNKFFDLNLAVLF